MTPVKGKFYKKIDFGIKFPRTLKSTVEINGEDYAFFTINDKYNNSYAPNGLIIEPKNINEVVQKDTFHNKKAYIFERANPGEKYKYIGELDIVKPYDPKRNLLVVK